MGIISLEAKPITKEAFAPYGTLIELEGSESFPINGGTTTRYHALAHMDVDHRGGSPILSIFRAIAWQQPITINMLERHPLGSQAFIPMGLVTNWLVVVADAPQPTAQDCRAFLVGSHQGVQYARNVWHHPLLVLSGPSDFLVADRAGPGENLEEHFFEGDTCKLVLPFSEHCFERGAD